LLSLSAPALAQRVVEGDLQQQMSPTEFKAAGLDKLSAQELATLNRWLQGKVEAATQAVAAVREEAREEGRQEVIVKNRGFFDFGSSEPITGVLQGEFRGFGKGRVYVLDNGQEWEQTDAAPGRCAQAIAERQHQARRDGRVVHEGGRREQPAEGAPHQVTP
jgi:hypothetical protein